VKSFKKTRKWRYAVYAVIFAQNFRKIHLKINRNRYQKFRHYFATYLEKTNDDILGNLHLF
jgi:hypothetical protein